MISRFCKKTVLSVLILTLLIPSGFFLYPKKSEAQVVSCLSQVAAALGFSAVADELSRVATSNDSTTKMSTAGSFVSDCILKPLVVKMAKALLNDMTRKTVEWINNGFQGNPGFATDLSSLLSDAADDVIGDFMAKDAAFLCSRFSFQLRFTIAQSQLPYRKRSACTFTDIVNNINGFIDNNNSVGWDNWIQITTIPQNNAYGAFAIAQDEISKRIIDVQEKEKTYLNWGRGFKDWKYCESQKEAEDRTRLEAGYSPEIDVSGLAVKECRRETPGAIVQERLSATLNVDLQQIGLADDLNAVFDALTNQLTKQIMEKSFGLLGGTRGPRKTVVAPSDYRAAGQNTVIPSGTLTNTISAGFNTGLAAGTTELSTALSNPPPVNAGGGGGPTGNPPTVGGPTGTQTLDLTLNPGNSTFVSAASSLFYEAELRTNYRTDGLLMRTAFKNASSMADVPFSIALTGVNVEFVRADGSSSTFPITSNPQATVGWSDIWTDSGKPFTIRITAAKKSGGVPGNYVFQTVVYDVQGNTLGLEDHYIVVQ